MQKFVRKTPMLNLVNQAVVCRKNTFASIVSQCETVFSKDTEKTPSEKTLTRSAAKRPHIDVQQTNSLKHRIGTVLSLQRSINAEVGYNMFDNDGWRDWAVADVMHNNGYNSFTLLNSRVGRDAQCVEQSLFRIEIKTSKVSTKRLRANNGFAEFCRQNTEQGANTALNGYDGIIFALFQKYRMEPVLAVFIRQSSGLAKLQALVKEKQNLFQEAAVEQNSTMVNGRDSIRVPLREVYERLALQEYELYYLGKRVNDEEMQEFVSALYSRDGIALPSHE